MFHVLQNAAFVLLMRLSKVMDTHYNSTVAVLITEMAKAPLAFILLCHEKASIGAACAQISKDICGAPLDTLKLAVPALLYTVQNNALFVAVGHLEAAVFHVTYQLKTLTTAILVVIVLKRRLLPHQWLSLFILASGTILVQEPPKASATTGASTTAASSERSLFFFGVAMTVVACLCSSFASVYLEKILIESKPSIWVRNLQLCIFTIPIAFSATLLGGEDKFATEDGSMLHGFGWAVWASVATNAAGGMIVAVVMKFAGNVLRNFAQACAIIVGGIGSWAFFGFQITSRFTGGVALVIASIFLYGSTEEQLEAWKQQVLSKLGLQSSASYMPVASSEELELGEPELDEEEAPLQKS